jgi:1,2-diacylglycerol 3-beta-glucosyltransferase
MTVVETVLSGLALLASLSVVYYLIFFSVGLYTTRRRPSACVAGEDLTFAIVIPAHNEEVVIESTVRRLKDLRGRWVAYVMNDGSADRTSALAHEAAAGDPRIRVIDRDPAIAGQGKGEVLNHAYRLISEQVVSGGDTLLGDTPDDVVICVVDADGWLEPHALEHVAPLMADPRVGGVQLPVRMWNATDSYLTLMQDAEFLSFGRLVQAGRDPVGSVGLGGNGQFVRLAALQQQGRAPWSRCLTEDLDLSMALISQGWRLRFCPHAAVAQQGLPGWRALLRQRTRWIQGHYSCWQHIRPVLRGNGSVLQKIDATFYLLAVALVPVFFTLLICALGNVAGLWEVFVDPWSFIDHGWVHYGVTTCLAVLPVAFVMVAYWQSKSCQVPLWAMPGVFLLFSAYGYAWAVPASVRAWGRLATRKSGWAKTARVPITGEALAAEARTLRSADAHAPRALEAAHV